MEWTHKHEKQYVCVCEWLHTYMNGDYKIELHDQMCVSLCVE